jgi:hypothetical protein
MSDVRGSPPPASNHWAEIDLLRALAGALMVSNHAGIRWLPSAQADRGLAGAVIFVGSLAPVLFFSVTGIGRGVRATAAGATRRPITDVLRRVMVLVFADAALWLAPGVLIGMDFLGFIALSTLVIELVNDAQRPGVVAAVGVGACLVVRFGVGPHLGLAANGSAFAQLIRFAVGDGAIPGFSYALTPWLAYPLLGLWVGRFVAARANVVRSTRGRCAVAVAVAAAAGFCLCLVMAHRHLVFFRWGSMSLAYCVFGFSALLGSLSIVLVAAGRLQATAVKALSLSGVASFILVPVHYLLVAAAQRIAPDGVRTGFPIALPILIGAVFWVSKWLDRRISALVRKARGTWWSSVLLLAILAILVRLVFVPRNGGESQRLLLMVSAQLLACGLFVFTSGRRVIGGAITAAAVRATQAVPTLPPSTPPP